MYSNRQNRDRHQNLVLDTTLLLPAFGVEVNVDTSDNIKQTLKILANEYGVKFFISDITPLEGFLKSFRLAEKLKSEKGKRASKIGFLAVTRDPIFTVVSHFDEDTLNEAYEIRESHRDPFDCFIFATARSLKAILVSEDTNAEKFLDKERVVSWKNLKKTIL